MLEHMSPSDYAVVRTGAWPRRRASTRPASRPSTRFRRSSAPPSNGCSNAASLQLIDVYEQGYSLEDVYQLAEQLITWDERAIVWRFQHLKTVERIIGGNVIGTQGTPVEVLGKRIDVRFFPDLWLVRDEITRRSALGTDGHGH